MYSKLILHSDFDLLRLDGVVLGQILLGVTGLVGVGLGVVGTVGVGSFWSVQPVTCSQHLW